jgi:hypothetical protein
MAQHSRCCKHTFGGFPGCHTIHLVIPTGHTSYDSSLRRWDAGGFRRYHVGGMMPAGSDSEDVAQSLTLKVVCCSFTVFTLAL